MIEILSPRSVVAPRGRIRVQAHVGGELVFEDSRPNLITSAGLNVIRDVMLRTGVPPAAIAGGDDDGTSLTLSTANTALGNERFRKKILRRDSSVATAKFQTVFTESEGNGGGSVTYKEMGLFTSTVADDPIMIARAFHTNFTKTSSAQLTYTWEIDFI